MKNFILKINRALAAKKKFFILFLALAANAGSMFANVQIGDLYYDLDSSNKTAKVTYKSLRISSGYSNYYYNEGWSIETAIIPDSIVVNNRTYRVISINDNAFRSCKSLTSVTIPNSVTSIGDNAFYNCTGLTKVNITDISAWCNIAFSYFESNPLYYAKHLYLNDVEVTDLTIPNSVTSIGGYAFSRCTGLTSVTIPNSVTSIGDGAFLNCSGLTSPVYNAHIFVYLPKSYSGAYVIPEGIESIAGSAFCGCTGLTSVTIGNSVTSIGEGAFINCSGLTSIEIPNNVTSIGSSAFYYCSGLNSVMIPNSVISIGENAFKECSNLKVVINNSALNIVKGSTDYGYIAYYASNVYSGVDTIGDFVFVKSDGKDYVVAYFGSDCQITLPKNYRGNSYGIGAYLFYNNTTVNSITIPNAVTSIGDYAFRGCSNLNVVYIGNSVISIGEKAFYECPELYKIIMLPNSVPSGINSAFQSLSGRITYVGNANYESGYGVLGTQRIYTNLSSYFSVDGIVYALVNPSKRTCDIIDCDYSGATTEFSIGNSVVYSKVTLSVDSINVNAFRNNKRMTKLVIDFNHALPSHMASYCSSIDTLIITSNVGNIGTNAFTNSSKSTDAYFHINNSGNISSFAFANCDKLHKLVIADSVKNIGDHAFYQCANIANADIYNNGGIGTQAFRYSSTNNIATYHLHNNGAINDYAFANCSSIKNLVIDSCVSTIGQYAFQKCISLEDVTIKNKGEIGKQAFEGSSTRNPATYIISNAGAIDESAFANCTYIKDLVIDSCVSTIGQYAFQKCTRLEDVTIKNNGNIGKQAFEGSSTGNPATYIISNVGSIDESAFANCSSIDTLIITSNVGNIGTNAFSNSSKNTNAYFNINNSGDISTNSFANCTGLYNIIIADSVKNIGNQAFYQCANIANADIYNKGEIGKQAFEGSSTRNPATYIISNAGAIDESAFANCTYIKDLVIDSCVSTIGQYAFQKCTRLEDVTIKNNGNIGKQAFEGSSTRNPATYMISNAGAIDESAFANCTSVKNLVIDSCVSAIGQYAFQKCISLEDVTIKNNGNIYKQAFEGSSTQSPATYKISNVGSIGESAFANCTSLHKVRLGNQISSIGKSAFSACVLLDSISLPNSVASLGNSVFYNCSSLAYIKLSNTISSIGNSAFAGCSALPELFIPKSANTIGQSAFNECSSLAVVSFENGTNTLSLGRNDENKGLFYDCPLDSVFIGRELNYPQTASDGYSPFYRNPSLRSIVVSDFPTKVEANEFYGCTNLYYVYIGNGVQSIGDYAFSGCSLIDYFSFGEKVQTIGAEAFSDCVAMTRLYSYCQTPPTCGASALEDINKWTCTLYIPIGTTDVYSNADQWKDFFFFEESAFVKYTILVDFDSSKGNVTGAGVYEKGTEVVLVATPAEGYKFVGWEDGSKDPVRHITVNQSAIYTANFNTTYTVTFKNGEEVLQSTEVEYGQIPAYNGEVPTKQADAQYTYTFAGWTPEVEAVTGNATYTAQFIATKISTNTCEDINTTWLQTGGTDLGEITTNNSDVWTYNSAYGAYGSKQGGATGWLLTPSMNLSEMQSVTLSFRHTHKFATNPTEELTLWVCADYKGSVEASSWQQLTIYPYAANTNWKFVNVSIDVPLDKVGPNTVFGFKYVSTVDDYGTWEIKNLHLEAECKYVAPETYTITFLNYDGTELQVLTDMEEGTMPVYTGVTPTKPSDEQYTYTFAGWTPNVVAVTGNATYSAMFNSELNMYSITSNTINGDVEGTGVYAYGTEIELTAIPNNGYIFEQWSDGVKNNPRTIIVTGDTEYIAFFIADIGSGIDNQELITVTKLFRDGQILILRGEKVYTVTGQEVR